jgi:type VI secretion system protein ImpH
MNGIIDAIEKDFYSFDIDQLVNIIKEIFDDDDAPGVFFESDPSLAFPPSDISSVRIDNVSKSATVTLPIMNLLGISSPLPVKFSDYITRNQPDAEFYRDFLSIAQNRIHALWLDARQKYAYWNDTVGAAKTILESMLPRSSSSLKQLIKSIWKDIPVIIEENLERQASVDNARPLGGSARLGQTAVAGAKVRDRASKFRVSLGPLEYGLYKTFLPGESNCRRIENIIKSHLNEPLLCELEISCRQADLPQARTGGPHGGRLGRTVTLGAAEEGRVHRYRAELNKKLDIGGNEVYIEEVDRAKRYLADAKERDRAK